MSRLLAALARAKHLLQAAYLRWRAREADDDAMTLQLDMLEQPAPTEAQTQVEVALLAFWTSQAHAWREQAAAHERLAGRLAADVEAAA